MGCWGQWVGADTCAVSGRGVSGSEGYIRFWAVVCQETCELWHSTAQNGDPWGPGRVPVWGAGLRWALGQAERMFCRV